MSAKIGARSHPVYQRLCDLKKSGNAGRYGLLFSTQFKNYFYDTGTGKVLHIGDYEFKALQAFFDPTISLDAFEKRCHQMAGDRLEKFLTTIDSEKLLCAPPVTAMHLASDDNWLEALDSDLQQLVLEVTEACNFRCKYCIYNEDYEGNRDFGTAKMPQEIAQKAIDYLAEHSSSHFAVTFYGGEPLANFPLVRWATEYTLEHYKDKHPTFNLTTNLTLVTDEIADFLARTPGFSVVVSLDGPEEVQNAARVYSANKPTFADAMRGLNTLSKAFIKHGKSLTINSVLIPPYTYEKLERINSFFESLDFLPPLTQCMITYPSPGTFPVENAVELMSGNPTYEFGAALNPLLKWQFEKAKQNGLSWEHTQNIYFNTMLKMMETIDGRMVTDAPDDLYHCNGCCVPGSRKLYVKANGDLLICERIGSSTIIGNIFTGIDKTLLSEKYDTEYVARSLPACKNCWAVNLCPICYANCYTEDGIDPAEKASNCNGVRSQLERCFSMFYELLEENPSALDALKETTRSS